MTTMCLKATYQTTSKVLGLEWSRNSKINGNFKVCAFLASYFHMQWKICRCQTFAYYFPLWTSFGRMRVSYPTLVVHSF